ncbi:MAG: DgsA anti-repressor MtfA [Azospira oryzae]|jgi:Mlc titration factor MtfA (ptsG expression regulator)|nr:MAG: DgsA anti-repressor MtfA [Azospira oryzae]
MAAVYASLYIIGFLFVVNYIENFHAFNRILFPLDKEVKKYLTLYFPFYRKLSFRKKHRFEKKVKQFLNSFEYRLKDGIILTPEMKAVLGGAAIRITFYLPDECFDYYDTMVLYPQPYYSRVNNRYHKGEVNPGAKVIVFSWSSIRQGLDPHDDGINLLIHEYAHALYFEHKLMHEAYPIFNAEAFRRFTEQEELEIKLLRSGAPHFLRKYAGTNEEEFFAVAVESFFERSAAFKKELPELYGTLVLLLRQDPLKN